jgi:hypothetical protein
MFGVVDPTGRNETTNLNLQFFEDGTLRVNGSPVVPIHKELSPTNADVAVSAVYNAAEISRASGPNGSDRAPFYGATPEQQAALGAAMDWLTSTAMGGRPRYLIVSPEADMIAFADIDADSQPTNVRAPRCTRIQ